jgi:hypothetical protein
MATNKTTVALVEGFPAKGQFVLEVTCTTHPFIPPDGNSPMVPWTYPINKYKPDAELDAFLTRQITTNYPDLTLVGDRVYHVASQQPCWLGQHNNYPSIEKWFAFDAEIVYEERLGTKLVVEEVDVIHSDKLRSFDLQNDYLDFRNCWLWLVTYKVQPINTAKLSRKAIRALQAGQTMMEL